MPKSRVTFEDRSRIGQYDLIRRFRDRADRIAANEPQNIVRENREPRQPYDEPNAAVGDLQLVDRELAPEENLAVPPGVNDDNNRAGGDGQEEEEDGGENDDNDSDLENESDSEDELGAEGRLNPDAALYPGAPVTIREVMLAVLSVQVSHSLTKSCVSDIFELLGLVCPRENFNHISLYKYRKFFRDSEAPIVKHFYCSLCTNTLASENAVCTLCDERKGVSYFVQLPMIPQLREMYKRDSFYNILQHRFNRQRQADDTIEDIYDGLVYKEQVNNGILADPNNISFMWYTDGAPVYNSRNYSIWPFMFMINELPYHLRGRRENVLLGGLWFGPHKPVANKLMKALIPDLRRLFHGVRIHPANLDARTVRGIVIAGVCDTPAKSAFLNCVGHQGFYGCPVCEIRGESFQENDEAEKQHVYRYQRQLVIRNVPRFQECARRAFNAPDPVFGVKGPTALRLFMPDFLKGMAIDPMHLVTGVTKKLLKLHFGPQCSRFTFSLRTVQYVADRILLKVKPPKFIHRLPSSLEHYNRWKASELLAWLFYYAVAIYEIILPPQYFNHFLKFLAAISYLNSDSVSPGKIQLAEELLHDFVREFEELYGARFCSINVHLLLHLPDCVRRLGPLWTYSCMPLENLNGIMLASIHGKTNVDSQLCNSYWHYLQLSRLMELLRDESLRMFLNKRKRSLRLGEQINSTCFAVGKEYNGPLPAMAVAAFHRANVDIANCTMTVYFRLLKTSHLYVSDRYPRSMRSNSSFVAYQLNNEIKVGCVDSFVKLKRCRCACRCICDKEHYALITCYEQDGYISLRQYQRCKLSYIHRYKETVAVIAVPVLCLRTVCVTVTTKDALYISTPVNSKEVE